MILLPLGVGISKPLDLVAQDDVVDDVELRPLSLVVSLWFGRSHMYSASWRISEIVTFVKKNTKLYNIRISLTCTLHSQQNEHCDNSQESSNGINDDKFQRIIIWNEQDVEHCGGWQVACQETTGVGQNRFRVDDVQAEKGDCPNAVENLKGK